MSVILSLLGIVIAAAGVGAIGFGIPINEFTLGTTLMIVGTTALTGGLILIGLGAVVAELGRLAEVFKARPAVRPTARPAEAAEPAGLAATAGAAAVTASGLTAGPSQAPVPGAARSRVETPMGRAPEPYVGTAPSTVDASASAIERLRSAVTRSERAKAEPSIVADAGEVPLSPNGGAHHRAAQRAALETGAPEPKVTAEDRAGSAAVETLKASRLDFLFRSKPERAAPQGEGFGAFRPTDARPGRSVDPEPQPRLDEAPSQAEQAPPVEAHQAESAAAEPAPATAILKSGVVDGMAYTLYADGSIEAKLPDGTVRFGSIAELRAHIESNS
jgi:hypothetical protein